MLRKQEYRKKQQDPNHGETAGIFKVPWGATCIEFSFVEKSKDGEATCEELPLYRIYKKKHVWLYN